MLWSTAFWHNRTAVTNRVDINTFNVTFTSNIEIPFTPFQSFIHFNMILASTARSMTDKLQRVLNAGAHFLSGRQKYRRGLSRIPRGALHWLDVADQDRYKLGVTVNQRLYNKVPQYLVGCLCSSLRHHQSSATTFCWPYHAIHIAHSASGILSHRTHCLVLASRPIQRLRQIQYSGNHWKHFSSTSISVSSALEVYTITHYKNPHFTYLLTYLLTQLMLINIFKNFTLRAARNK